MRTVLFLLHRNLFVPLWVVLIVGIPSHVGNCLNCIDFISVSRLYLHKAESMDPSVLLGLRPSMSVNLDEATGKDSETLLFIHFAEYNDLSHFTNGFPIQSFVS